MDGSALDVEMDVGVDASGDVDVGLPEGFFDHDEVDALFQDRRGVLPRGACNLALALLLFLLALQRLDAVGGSSGLPSALEPHRFSAYGGRCYTPLVCQNAQEKEASAAF